MIPTSRARAHVPRGRGARRARSARAGRCLQQARQERRAIHGVPGKRHQRAARPAQAAGVRLVRDVVAHVVEQPRRILAERRRERRRLEVGQLERTRSRDRQLPQIDPLSACGRARKRRRVRRRTGGPAATVLTRRGAFNCERGRSCECGHHDRQVHCERYRVRERRRSWVWTARESQCVGDPCNKPGGNYDEGAKECALQPERQPRPHARSVKEFSVGRACSDAYEERRNPISGKSGGQPAPPRRKEG